MNEYTSVHESHMRACACMHVAATLEPVTVTSGRRKCIKAVMVAMLAQSARLPSLSSTWIAHLTDQTSRPAAMHKASVSIALPRGYHRQPTNQPANQ